MTELNENMENMSNMSDENDLIRYYEPNSNYINIELMRYSKPMPHDFNEDYKQHLLQYSLCRNIVMLEDCLELIHNDTHISLPPYRRMNLYIKIHSSIISNLIENIKRLYRLLKVIYGRTLPIILQKYLETTDWLPNDNIIDLKTLNNDNCITAPFVFWNRWNNDFLPTRCELKNYLCCRKKTDEDEDTYEDEEDYYNREGTEISNQLELQLEDQRDYNRGYSMGGYLDKHLLIFTYHNRLYDIITSTSSNFVSNPDREYISDRLGWNMHMILGLEQEQEEEDEDDEDIILEELTQEEQELRSLPLLIDYTQSEFNECCCCYNEDNLPLLTQCNHKVICNNCIMNLYNRHNKRICPICRTSY